MKVTIIYCTDYHVISLKQKQHHHNILVCHEMLVLRFYVDAFVQLCYENLSHKLMDQNIQTRAQIHTQTFI